MSLRHPGGIDPNRHHFHQPQTRCVRTKVPLRISRFKFAEHVLQAVVADPQEHRTIPLGSGLQLITNGNREADESKPKSCHEDNQVKTLTQAKDRSWLTTGRRTVP